MKRQKFSAKDVIPRLNSLKRTFRNGKPFTKQAILEGLKQIGLPYNNTFQTVFFNSNIIKRVGKSHYEFCDADPIHYSRLQVIWDKYGALCRKYNKRHLEKKASAAQKAAEETEQTTAQEVEEITEAFTQFAIDYLKDLGYKVLAPVGVVYQDV